MDDLIHTLLSSRDQDESENADIWNLFSQLLVPIVILLGVLVAVLVYKYSALNSELGRYRDSPQEKMGEALNEAQQERLLAALEKVMAEERRRLGLGYFNRPEDIKMDGLHIRDQDRHLSALSDNIMEIAASNGRRVRSAYLGAIYGKTLSEAKVADDLAGLSRTIEDVSSEAYIWYSDKHDHPSTDAVRHITRNNRFFILDKAAQYAAAIERDVITLQRTAIQMTAIKLVEAVQDPGKIDETRKIDETGKLLATQMATQPDLVNTRKFHEYVVGWLSERLEKEGFHFLDRAWEPEKKLPLPSSQ
jgi:hypothetical protein